MASTQRRFLACKAAAVAGLVCLRGCPDAGDSAQRRALGCTGPASARFIGDPGSDHVLYGASLPYTSSILMFERQLGRRLESTAAISLPARPLGSFATVRDDHVNHRLSIVSTKCPGTWAQVAEGQSDGSLRTLLQQLSDEGYPVMLALHHEPKNDWC